LVARSDKLVLSLMRKNAEENGTFGRLKRGSVRSKAEPKGTKV
jgi:hypothetical protein